MNLSSLQLTTIDFLIMAVYILITVAIILILRLKEGDGTGQMFLGNRNLPGWLSGISYAISFVSLDKMVLYSGLTVITGLYIHWLYLGHYAAGWMVAAFLFASLWRKTNLNTPAEFYQARFAGEGGEIIRSWVAFRSAFISGAAWSGLALLAFTKIAGPVFGLSKLQAILLIVPPVLLLTLISGYRGISVISAFHSIIIIAGLLVLAVAVIWDFNGPLGLREAVSDAWGSGVLRNLPPLKDEILSVSLVIIWFFSGTLGYGGDIAPLESPHEGQRILASQSPEEAARMFVWVSIISFALIMLVTLPSLGAMALWPDLRSPAGDHELAFGLLIRRYFPPGLLGLFMISLMATVISTIATHINSGAQMAVFDLYKIHINQKGSDKHYLMVSRTVTVIILLLAVPVAMGTEYLFDVVAFMVGVNIVYKLADWAQWWWWRFNIYARLVASVGGPFIYLIVRYLIFTGGPYWKQLLFSTIVCTVFWVIAALVTRQPDQKTLVEFYRSAQPPGFWKPIKRLAEGG